MARYSHSKLSTFENCRYQYKLRYIDKIKPEYETSIEAFMGMKVHDALEELHKRVMAGRSVSKQGMIRFYEAIWEESYTNDILIVKPEMTAKDYQEKGAAFLNAYYEKYYPFNQLEIIELETNDLLKLPDGSEWFVRIDKFAKDKEGNYYVIDYKTNGRRKEQYEIETDRQLGMYSIWVKEQFPDAKRVKLVWNMLAFNEEVISEKTPEQEKTLLAQVLARITEIQNAKEYPAKVTGLCNYCGYKNMCEYYQESLKKRNI